VARHRTLATGVGAAAVMAIVSLAAATVLLSRANEREREQKKRAEHNFALARAAVDQMLTEVASRELFDVPQMEPVRKRLLEKGARALPAVPRGGGGRPGRWPREAGRAYRRVGDIHALLGQSEQAQAAFAESIAIFARLVEEAPRSARLSRRPGQRFTTPAGLHMRARDAVRGAAKAHPARPWRCCEQLAADFPASASYRQQVAHSLNNLGVVLEELGGKEEAERSYRRAIALQQRLVDEFPATRRVSARPGPGT